ncbi:pyridoxal phosphate-dependent transferase [Aspergillus stella-maris]|uniref:pyridoxal phosphate-dependent transferase n=1 Tax=Aspergillus stella-maris TaxID=1810926 RepID=UPI003CCE0CB5
MALDLTSIPELPRDEAFAVTADFKADTHPQKVSLGAGVYRDEHSQPWILSSVREAKKRIHDDPTLDHEYLPIQGHGPFLEAARNLILGENKDSSRPWIRPGSVISVQTISGTGANSLAASFLSNTLKPKHVFFSDPTWSNHSLIWEVHAPGVIRKTYPHHYAAGTRKLDVEAIISTFEETAIEGDVVILHACAHNPTGIDPSHEQWSTLAEVIKRKRLFALFDSAYQGFASGDFDDDAWAVRYFGDTLCGDSTESQNTGIGLGICQSFAKNFGLYGERVGAFHLVLPSPGPSPSSMSAEEDLGSAEPKAGAGAKSHLLRLIRSNISNAPLFGARIVAMVLGTPELREMWERDLRTMSGRIERMRSLLRAEIERDSDVGDWSFLEGQIGMFSYTGLSERQVDRLRDVHHIYLMRNGRVSMSGVNEGNVKYVAEAIVEVVRYYQSDR